jgi:hypothetical protein
MITREANIEDWDKLMFFFNRVYRKNHPLQSREFWNWQYGNVKYGRSFICLNDEETIVGHVGANFGGDVAWIINVYLDREYRGKGILGELYSLARAYYPLAATAANEAGLGLYKNMQWIRYYNLIRYVKINPSINNITTDIVCKPVNVDVETLINNETHYFQQPSIIGVRLADGTTAISQKEVGGLRIVSLENLERLENEAWCLGYNWIDYITSWNDLVLKKLEKNGWVLDNKSIIPWRLNPIENDHFCDISYLSEKPLPNDFIVRRFFSDHGRIGSL